MRPNEVVRETSTSGSLGSSYFGAEEQSLVHLFRVLRDSLYSDKPLAVLREYGANAWDEHREAGKPDVPIKVTLPTPLEASVIIRDFGRGLSHQSVLKLLTMYGASLKRDTNNAVGKYGIGAKSGFAYNDAFTVTSFHGGLKMVFHAFLDETDVGVASKMFEAASGAHLRDFGKAVLGLDLAIADDWQDTRLVINHDAFVEMSKSWDLGLLPTIVDGEVVLAGELLDYLRKIGLVAKTETPTEDHIRFLVRREILIAHISATFAEYETGLQVKIPVKPSDVHVFHQKARRLFRFFRPWPIINLNLEKVPSTWETANGWLRRANEHHYEDDWVAVMGCIPYKLDMAQVEVELEERGLSQSIKNLRGGLYFEIGEVDIIANREQLEYKPRTKKAIVDKFEAVIEEISKDLKEIIADGALDSWERRLRIQEFVQRTGIPCKDDVWRSVPNITLYKERLAGPDGKPPVVDGTKEPLNLPKHFTLKKVKIGARGKLFLAEDSEIAISRKTRILVKDDPRNFRGFIDIHNFYGDLILLLNEGSTTSNALNELRRMLKERGIDGIPNSLMSKMTYRPLYVQRGDAGESNPKHSQRIFALNRDVGNRGRLSDNWATVDRVPEESDVFVLVHRFKPVKGMCSDSDTFFLEVDSDRKILKNVFGIDMPPIYGYKTLLHHPVNPDEVPGTLYSEWITGFIKEALEARPEFAELVEAYSWKQLTLGSPVDNWNRSWETEVAAFLGEHFHARHSILQIFRKRVRAAEVERNFRQKYGHQVMNAFEALMGTSRHRAALPESSAGKEALAKLVARYPLLNPTLNDLSGLGHFTSKAQRHMWVQYIKMQDRFHNDVPLTEDPPSPAPAATP